MGAPWEIHKCNNLRRPGSRNMRESSPMQIKRAESTRIALKQGLALLRECLVPVSRCYACVGQNGVVRVVLGQRWILVKRKSGLQYGKILDSSQSKDHQLELRLTNSRLVSALDVELAGENPSVQLF